MKSANIRVISSINKGKIQGLKKEQPIADTSIQNGSHLVLHQEEEADETRGGVRDHVLERVTVLVTEVLRHVHRLQLFVKGIIGGNKHGKRGERGEGGARRGQKKVTTWLLHSSEKGMLLVHIFKTQVPLFYTLSIFAYVFAQLDLELLLGQRRRLSDSRHEAHAPLLVVHLGRRADLLLRGQGEHLGAGGEGAQGTDQTSG
jgi:hypothetical protein